MGSLLCVGPLLTSSIFDSKMTGIVRGYCSLACRSESLVSQVANLIAPSGCELGVSERS